MSSISIGPDPNISRLSSDFGELICSLYKKFVGLKIDSSHDGLNLLEITFRLYPVSLKMELQLQIVSTLELDPVFI